MPAAGIRRPTCGRRRPRFLTRRPWTCRTNCARRSRTTCRATRTTTRRRSRRSWPRRGGTAGAPTKRSSRWERSCRSRPRTCRRSRPSTTCCAPSPSARATCTCAPACPATCGSPPRSTRRSRKQPRRRGSRASKCASANAWAPATWRRWRPSTGASSARSRARTRPSWSCRSRRGARSCPAAGSATRASSCPGGRVPELKVLTEFFGEKDVRSIDGYIDNAGGYGALRKVLDSGMDPDEVLAEVDASGLRGRGGAGFATGKKASFIPKGDQTNFLTCNADESEPGTFKDRQLIQYSPQRLVEGCILASYAIGASFAFIYIRGEYVMQAEILEQAVREAYERGFLGADILGSRYSLELVVHRGAGAYICGEESALLDSLEGKRGNPRLKPPFPAIKGLYQGPTLINNVETLSNVPLIVERGAEWWKSMGTEKSPGTKVVTVSGNVARPGNYEIELGIPAREIVEGLAGGVAPGRRVKFWHPGGSSAPVLLEEHLDLGYDFETMAAAGSMLGSGAIIVADETVPVVPYAKRLPAVFRHESCGKCVPCREGTNWTEKMFERMELGLATPMALDIMGEVQQNIEGNCLCVLGDSMAMPVRSLLKHFRSDFAEAIEAGRFGGDELASEHAGLGSVDVRVAL